MRQLRQRKGVTQKEMAEALGVTPAYLSALEHGKRGAPSWPLVQKIVGYFNIIWDEAEDLQSVAQISHPRVTVDTSTLSASATLLANRVAVDIRSLSEGEIAELIAVLDRAAARSRNS